MKSVIDTHDAKTSVSSFFISHIVGVVASENVIVELLAAISSRGEIICTL
jgi:hypothetical protein